MAGRVQVERALLPRHRYNCTGQQRQLQTFHHRTALPSTLRTAVASRKITTANNAGNALIRSGVFSARILRRLWWPIGASASALSLPITRNVSFARAIPKLFLKAARIPAAFGGAMIAGMAYIQYQAAQAGNYAMDVLKQAKETASDTAGTLYGRASGILAQTRDGWERTTEEVKMGDWMRRLFGDGNGAEEGGGGGGPKQNRSGAATVAGGAATAFAYDNEDEGGEVQERIARDDQMMILTRKMIEIRSLLNTVGQSGSLTLPSIVVVGSQSSGKSSVLEAIVGHEFLPKGLNMVTRRPIELTLVNVPDGKTDYAEFPSLGLGKLTDFSHVQQTLTELNMAVPPEQCVSDDPIHLRIHSPNVPDLSLIDLPGYIQVVGKDQPLELKEKIAELCEKYIQPPNVILAISAADVDLANSTALRASRKVDPRGERTIGVITKMDLVDPERGAQMLQDNKYALRLGYVGVISRIPQITNKFFSRGPNNILDAVIANENAFFSSHTHEFGPASNAEVGVGTLRKKLMHVLEQTMSSSLATTAEAINAELAEATYEFKVQYNERTLSAETYLAESLDSFKHSFKDFSDQFGRQQIRELLKLELEQQVLNLLAQRYWNKPLQDLSVPLLETESLRQLPKAEPDNPLWQLKLDATTASLTKLGVGRLATAIVAKALQARIDELVHGSNFSSHPFARQAINNASSSIIRDLSYSTSDELEICIKPYKFRIDLGDNEWRRGRDNMARVLKEELRVCEDAYKKAEAQIGGKKLKDVVAFIEKVRQGQIYLEGDGIGGAGGFSSALLAKGILEIFLLRRSPLANIMFVYRTRRHIPSR